MFAASVYTAVVEEPKIYHSLPIIVRKLMKTLWENSLIDDLPEEDLVKTSKDVSGDATNLTQHKQNLFKI